MYVQIAVGTVCLVFGFGLGDRLATGRYEAELRLAESAYRAAQDAAIAETSAKLEAESKRAVAAAEARGRRVQAAQEIVNEIHILPDTRDCEWSPEQRMRIERIYAAYDSDPTPRAGVSYSLSPGPLDGATQRGLGSLDP